MPPLIPSSSSSTMENKTVLVTGANSGLGLETSRVLLRKGATVILACRTVQRGQIAVNELSAKQESARDRAVPMELDLSSLSSVRSFCSSFLSRFPRLDVLVCNAGVMHPMEEHRRTRDGFEANVGVNHLGHFLLVNLLLDRLVSGGSGRVVVVSSMLLKEGEVHLDNLNGELGLRAPPDGSSSRTPTGYADSKLMNALFAAELRRRLGGSGAAVACVSPGWCRTRLHQHGTVGCLEWPMLLLMAAVFMKSASKGCETIVHCCSSRKISVEGTSSPPPLFYRNKKPLPDMDAWLEERKELAGELWKRSAELVGLQTEDGT